MRVLHHQRGNRIIGWVRRRSLIFTSEKVPQRSVDESSDFAAFVFFRDLNGLVDGGVIGNLIEKVQLIQSHPQQVSNEGIRFCQGATQVAVQLCVDGAAPAKCPVDEFRKQCTVSLLESLDSYPLIEKNVRVSFLDIDLEQD